MLELRALNAREDGLTRVAPGNTAEKSFNILTQWATLTRSQPLKNGMYRLYRSSQRPPRLVRRLSGDPTVQQIGNKLRGRYDYPLLSHD